MRAEHEGIVGLALGVELRLGGEFAHALEAVLGFFRDRAVEEARRDEVFRVLQRPAQGHDPGRAAVIVFGRPVILRPRVGPAADRRQRHRRIEHQRVGLQPLVQRRQVGDGLQGRTGLTVRLRGAVQLAERIRKASRHGEDAAGLVFERHRRPLHDGPDAKLGPRSGLALRLRHADAHHVVELEAAPDGGVPGGERHDAAVGQADAEAAGLALALIEDHGRGPVHVVERQARVLQGLLPHGLRQRAPLRFRGRLDPPHGLGQVRLRPLELEAARVEFVARQTLLQRRLRRPLQGGQHGRAHRVGARREAVDSGERPGLAVEVIDEVEAGVAARPLQRDEARPVADRALHLVGADDAVLLQAAQHVGEALLRTLGIAIGVVVVRAFRQPGEKRPLLQGQGFGGLAEIALRRHLDAP